MPSSPVSKRSKRACARRVEIDPDASLTRQASRELAAGGALAQRIPGFSERRVQRDMAEQVAQAITDSATLLIEAGTGTGKTMAYLLPAVLSGKRTVVSTGTKNLQDQLYQRDLPRLLEALGMPVRTALLKGRANYLCRYRLKQAAEQPGTDSARILSLRQFMEASASGELADYGKLADQDPLRPRVTSTADNCLGTRCPDYDDCFVFAARRRALDADLVVVNHHLLFADFAVREAGFSEILPGAEIVIVDEAHQLPDLAASAFGQRLSTRQLSELSRDARRCCVAFETPAASETLQRLADLCAALESELGALEGRTAWQRLRLQTGVESLIGDTAKTLEALAALLDAMADDEERRRLAERCREQLTVLAAFVDRDPPEGTAPHGVDGGLEPDDSAVTEMVRWAEPLGWGGALCASPADISAAYRRAASGHPGAWIYVSATLSVNGRFDLFRGQLGLAAETRECVLPPVFDYESQCRLWVPAALPAPGGDQHTRALLRTVLPALEASDGGAFLLMTTHRAVKEAAALLRADGRFPLFVQSEDDRARLLRGFSEAGNGVLIGAASFWEGVDVPGNALRMVIIDKLPFAPPDDPVVEARRERIERDGGNAFMDYQLPQAILALRQGVGRLIRSESDRGLLVLGDPRVRSARYGAKVLRALPAMPQLEATEEAVAFAQQLHPGAPP